MSEITAGAIELSVMRYFDLARNFVIPNVSGGFRNMNYEIDLMVVTKARYAYEVEIKISAGDLMRDKKKWKWNYCLDQHYFRKSYFAIPESLLPYEPHIPLHAGILAVHFKDDQRLIGDVRVVREAKIDKLANKVAPHEYEHLGDLCMLRMWSLKWNEMLRRKKRK